MRLFKSSVSYLEWEDYLKLKRKIEIINSNTKEHIREMEESLQ